MSMVPIVSSAEELDPAIRFAQLKPTSRWYVAERARALGRPEAIPADWNIPPAPVVAATEPDSEPESATTDEEDTGQGAVAADAAPVAVMVIPAGSDADNPEDEDTTAEPDTSMIEQLESMATQGDGIDPLYASADESTYRAVLGLRDDAPDLTVAIVAAANMTQAERDEGAKTGNALPDGSYLIRNKRELRNAINLRNHGDQPRAKIYAHIRKRAKALGATDLLPDELKGTADAVAAAAAVLEIEREKQELHDRVDGVVASADAQAKQHLRGRVVKGDLRERVALTASIEGDLKKGWDEALHPRDINGKFITSGGSVHVLDSAGKAIGEGKAVGVHAGPGGHAIVTVRMNDGSVHQVPSTSLRNAPHAEARIGGDTVSRTEAHQASEHAFNLSAKAEQTGSFGDHYAASRAHQHASDMHREVGAVTSGHTADIHAQLADEHMNSANAVGAKGPQGTGKTVHPDFGKGGGNLPAWQGSFNDLGKGGRLEGAQGVEQGVANTVESVKHGSYRKSDLQKGAAAAQTAGHADATAHLNDLASRATDVPVKDIKPGDKLPSGHTIDKVEVRGGRHFITTTEPMYRGSDPSDPLSGRRLYGGTGVRGDDTQAVIDHNGVTRKEALRGRVNAPATPNGDVHDEAGREADRLNTLGNGAADDHADNNELSATKSVPASESAAQRDISPLARGASDPFGRQENGHNPFGAHSGSVLADFASGSNKLQGRENSQELAKGEQQFRRARLKGRSYAKKDGIHPDAVDQLSDQQLHDYVGAKGTNATAIFDANAAHHSDLANNPPPEYGAVGVGHLHDDAAQAHRYAAQAHPEGDVVHQHLQKAEVHAAQGRNAAVMRESEARRSPALERLQQTAQDRPTLNDRNGYQPAGEKRFEVVHPNGTKEYFDNRNTAQLAVERGPGSSKAHDPSSALRDGGGFKTRAEMQDAVSRINTAHNNASTRFSHAGEGVGGAHLYDITGNSLGVVKKADDGTFAVRRAGDEAPLAGHSTPELAAKAAFDRHTAAHEAGRQSALAGAKKDTSPFAGSTHDTQSYSTGRAVGFSKKRQASSTERLQQVAQDRNVRLQNERVQAAEKAAFRANVATGSINGDGTSKEHLNAAKAHEDAAEANVGNADAVARHNEMADYHHTVAEGRASSVKEARAQASDRAAKAKGGKEDYWKGFTRDSSFTDLPPAKQAEVRAAYDKGWEAQGPTKGLLDARAVQREHWLNPTSTPSSSERPATIMNQGLPINPPTVPRNLATGQIAEHQTRASIRPIDLNNQELNARVRATSAGTPEGDAVRAEQKARQDFKRAEATENRRMPMSTASNAQIAEHYAKGTQVGNHPDIRVGAGRGGTDMQVNHRNGGHYGVIQRHGGAFHARDESGNRIGGFATKHEAVGALVQNHADRERETAANVESHATATAKLPNAVEGVGQGGGTAQAEQATEQAAQDKAAGVTRVKTTSTAEADVARLQNEYDQARREANQASAFGKSPRSRHLEKEAQAAQDRLSRAKDKAARQGKA